jgi:hypothetical protein
MFGRKMKTSRLATFWTSWLRCFVRGLHALVAMMISSFIAQVAVWAVIGLISAILGGDEKFNGTIAEIVVPLACFGLVGLPLFGFLFSSAYSPAEPVEVKDQAEHVVAPNGP